MPQPGRVNIIDLSDLENNDVRNVAIAEVLRGLVYFQQEAYDAAVNKGVNGTRADLCMAIA